MFESRPWFSWYIVQYTRTDGSIWYLSHVHHDNTFSWTRDPLYARRFTGRMANIHVHWFRKVATCPGVEV